jgi:molybdopterin/thiamine biosynthesis adenylyltransferase
VELTAEELERYDRQIPVLGVEAQLKLKKSKVLVVGAGGLGSVVLLYLAAAGVGEIVVVDDGVVELSNLNRQVLYDTRDIGKWKVDVAAEKLTRLNPNVSVKGVKERATEDLLDKLVREVDLAIDALDNWETRFALNRVCVKHRKPLIHAGVQGFYGQLMVIIPGVTPCLNCILPKKPPEAGKIPVIGPTPAVLGALEANEAIKILTGVGKPALNKLLVYNGLKMEFTVVEVSRNPDCPVCGGVEREKEG